MQLVSQGLTTGQQDLPPPFLLIAELFKPVIICPTRTKNFGRVGARVQQVRALNKHVKEREKVIEIKGIKTKKDTDRERKG